MDDDRVLEALHEARGSTEQTLETVVDWAQKAVGGTGVGIFLVQRPDRSVETVLPTSPEIAKAHELQVDFAEGPCLDVLLDDSPGTFIVGDTSTDRRFPKWGPAAAALNLHSSMSAVMKTKQKTYGSLNVFADAAHAFDLDDLAVLELFARRAARAMAIAEDQEGLFKSLDTRKVIGQAQGILMERYDLESDAAFNFLVRQSQHSNTKLRAVAEWIVNHRKERSIAEPDF